jgi:hypothetical protein
MRVKSPFSQSALFGFITILSWNAERKYEAIANTF